MSSLFSIIQDHTINQCTWLLGNKPRYEQELMSSLQIIYPKRGCIDKYSKCAGLHLGELYYILPRPNILLASQIRISDRWNQQLMDFNIPLYIPLLYQLIYHKISYLRLSNLS